MGGKYGSSVLYLVKEVQRGELRQLGMHRLKSRHVPPGTDRNYPTIGVDCNMVINIIGRFKKDPVAALAGFLEEWADHGFVMLPVVDGASPHAKLATMEHIAKREVERAKALQKRKELRVTTKRLAEESLTAAERESLK